MKGEVEEPVVIEEDEATTQPDFEDSSDAYPDWKFVPNKAAYQLTVTPIGNTPLVTRVSFYLRIKEGCDGDLAPVDGRAPEYCLSRDDLLGCFKKYELTISTLPALEAPGISLMIDGKPTELSTESTIVKKDETTLEVAVRLRDTSDTFLVYQEGEPGLSKQQYLVSVVKRLSILKDKRTQIDVEVRNYSTRTQRSVIPERKVGKELAHPESEIEALGRLSNKLGTSALWKEYHPRLFSVEGVRSNPGGNRYGYLMEFEASETFISETPPYVDSDAAKTVNCIPDDSNLDRTENGYAGTMVFKDHGKFMEEVPVMAPGPSPKDLFRTLDLDGSLEAVFTQDLKFEYIFQFQALAIKRISEELRSKKDKATVLLSARTAGGKTEAFLIPIIDFCVKHEEKGVKALVFYPTKALANDQTSRYIEILYHLNKRLKGRSIRLGILHGDISKYEPEAGTEEEWDLPLACPACETGALKTWEKSNLKCESCGTEIDFVSVRNRQQVYADPPDILITNPDTLVWDVMMRPQNHSIFGRPVYVCKDCGWTYAPKTRKVRCENQQCKGTSLQEIRPCVPQIIVFDEVHMFKGTFGINCSYFISRLEGVLAKYSVAYHEGERRPMMRIGSTATILNPREFGKDFFNTKSDEIVLVPRDDDERAKFYLTGEKDKAVRRFHVFMMPYAYNTDSTVGRAIHYLEVLSKLGRPPTRLSEGEPSWDEYLQTITFVNSIRSSNNLIGLTRRTVAEDLQGLAIDGHTTDFDKKQRGKIERAFNRQELHVIFATQTLEVGVDFRRVDVVMVNGFPFSFNDYLQRIGRGGRNKDSLVVTVCQNWKPIDHYYYSNAREALRNPFLHIEPVPITRNNVEAMKKHARGAVFDFLISEKASSNYVEDFRSLANIKEMQTDIRTHVLRVVDPPGVFVPDVEGALESFLDYIQNLAQNEMNPNTLFTKFWKVINEEYQLTSLRSTDREVVVEVLWSV